MSSIFGTRGLEQHTFPSSNAGGGDYQLPTYEDFIRGEIIRQTQTTAIRFTQSDSSSRSRLHQWQSGNAIGGQRQPGINFMDWVDAALTSTNEIAWKLNK